MRSLDTNVILRLLLEDIPDQSRRADKVLSDPNCYVTDVAITELVFVLEKVYEASRNTIAASLLSLLSQEGLRSNFSLVSDMLSLYVKHESLSIVDCYLALEAENADAYLMTFDRKLLKYGGPHVLEP